MGREGGGLGLGTRGGSPGAPSFKGTIVKKKKRVGDVKERPGGGPSRGCSPGKRSQKKGGGGKP